MDFLDHAWQDYRDGRPSVEPMVEVYIQTATDPSLGRTAIVETRLGG